MGSSPDRLVVAAEPLSGPPAQMLIARLNAELTEAYPNPADRAFELTEAQVAPDQGVFLVARLDGEPIGCGALRRLDDGTGELKRMYVAPAARGRGVGRRILAELERHALALGLRRLVLETGDRQLEAMRLYTGAGYTRVPCFGEYAGKPLSVCLEKAL